MWKLLGKCFQSLNVRMGQHPFENQMVPHLNIWVSQCDKVSFFLLLLPPINFHIFSTQNWINHKSKIVTLDLSSLLIHL